MTGIMTCSLIACQQKTISSNLDKGFSNKSCHIFIILKIDEI